MLYLLSMKTDKAFSILYDDEHIVVLNKKSGLLVAADRYDPDAPRLDSLASEELGKLWAVHRIDKDTSGIVLYAKNAEAHRILSMAFQNREVAKTYHALVYGRPLWDHITVDAPLQVDGDARHRTVISKKFGKSSETYFKLIGVCGPYSWIEASPVSGRTHQIRVHLTDCGLSIVCDPLYGGNQKPIRLSEIKRSWRGDVFEERPLLDRLALHAYKIEFNHPATDERVSVTAPYQKDLESVRKQFSKLFKVDPLCGSDEEDGEEE